MNRQNRRYYGKEEFRNNYAQMEIDGVKTYGKVFEDDGKVVSIWSEVREALREYKSYFCE